MVQDNPKRGNLGAPALRYNASWARRGAFGALFLALLLDLVGLAIGFSRDGAWGWAVDMPQIVVLGVSAGVVSLVGIVLAIVRLTRQGKSDVTVWLALAGLIVTGLTAAVVAFIAMAASASV